MRRALVRTSTRLLPTTPCSCPRLAQIWATRSRNCVSLAASPAPREQGQWDSSRKMNPKRPFHNGGGGRSKKFKAKKAKPVKEGSAEEVLLADVQNMLAAQKLSEGGRPGGEEPPADAASIASLVEPGSEIEVDVVELASTGDGLARQRGSDRIYVVPFAVPGDTVKVKVYRHLAQEGYSIADFISVVKPSSLRDDSRIGCQYFAKCSGCQLQMLSYAEQLRFKKSIVEKAYRNFSQLPPELIPDVLDTIGSPLQYGYRTKLTPHFDGPPGFWKGKGQALERVPEIGFMQKGARKTLDIEDCPIGTDVVRKGMQRERERMKREYAKYTRGATILLRESTERHRKDADGKSQAPEEMAPDAVRVESGDRHVDIKTCITDNNATSTEYVDDYVFTNPAGAFFQNNNSVLPVFTSYIREHLLPPATADTKKGPIKYLIDAYSGSGLFTITLASLLPDGSIGIDIADGSIACARRNAALNGLPESRCRFVAADAARLFESVAGFDADDTAVVLDPPRRGCDAAFLRQLLAFAPRRVVYVSCNVHTQARDVGILVRGEVGTQGQKQEDAKKKEEQQEREPSKGGGARYEIESLRGFDFFPQTGHVEGVAVLNRVDPIEEVKAGDGP